ncbi:protein-disulfide reductase DsbD [Comamonas sp. NLF-1-9]|uniref:protein-disulfide reductase DsbD family protein n=1 Tax=Comamonas sp. NLF-1-9 TaxID=2853163 RepID=UPI001C48192D|nr:protein-disulfide reductase DsbD domain-containing protein [Comamonas sp. NLF-1-9]QXL84256.1 thioredoxin family protein [Comamonas sp. NLF-1-9]
MFARLRPLLPRALLLIAAAAVATSAAAQFQLKSSSGVAASNVVNTPHVRAELVAQAPEGVAPGKPLTLGLLLEHQPDWHTYWLNPGDSGLPTRLQWTLPAGVDAGEIAWPLPRKIPIGTLANYGYEGQVLLPVPMSVSSLFAPAPGQTQASFTVHASWLVCRMECVPEEGTLTLQLPLAGTTALNAEAFAAAERALPAPLATGQSSARVSEDAIELQVQGLPAAWRGQVLDVFPETPEVVHNAAEPLQQWQGEVWTARVPLSPERGASPELMPVVLGWQGAGLRVPLPVQGSWPPLPEFPAPLPVAAAASASTAAAAPALPARAPVAAAPGVWLLALGGALLGGLLLNLMPCVFPILAVKIAGFAGHAGAPRTRRIGALAYAGGVVLSFLALGALMLALRSAGQAVGWGFQLQSPLVVALLAALFTLIGLNLAGVFEVGMLLPSRWATAQARHPVTNAFLTGVLTVAVASPCTAPFMGASLGLTLGLPPVQALGIFVALGLGLAAPYLLASWWPAAARLLPRPGAWMDTFKRVLAFPMFATVVWLVWVLGRQSGIDGAAALLALLVALALAVWSLTLRGGGRWLLAPLSIAAGAWLLTVWGPKVVEMQAPSTLAATQSEDGWQTWRAGLPEELLSQGRAVFVDYTAAWCVTCQYNKKTTLANAEVRGDFAAKRIALLEADWTRQDPAITASITSFGRSGVPLYVLYAPGRAPVVFSEILGVRELRAALAAL